MKFHIETFGCQMNVADAEEMGRGLVARGFSPCSSAEEADWIIVNTCTVRDQAENRAASYVGRLRDWKKQGGERRILVTGCAAERMGDSVHRRFPHVDLVIGAKSISRFGQLIEPLLADPDKGSDEWKDAWSPETDYSRFLANGSATAFVTIMRGCNYSCSYCIVPAVRGRELYRPPESVIEEVRQKAAHGLSEILLLGQTVNSYRPASESGSDIADFAGLLQAVNAVPGVRRIRFMSPHPFYIDEKTARCFAHCENLCPHIHLPVQSGSDRVLSRMRRNYSRADYLRRVALLRQARPDISITTDFIVGFPGETEEDFCETLSLVDEADFDSAYCFRYSPRPGTESASAADDVVPEEKQGRLARLLEKLQAVSERKVQKLLGSRQEVLIDRSIPKDDGQRYEGRLRSFWKIGFSSSRARRVGETVAVTVTDAAEGSLRGHADL